MDSQSLPRYNPISDSSNSDSDLENLSPERPVQKKRKVYHVYKKDQAFNCLKSAKTFIKNEKMWNFRFTSDTEEGKKLFYNCKYDRSCEAKFYLLLVPDNSEGNKQSH